MGQTRRPRGPGRSQPGGHEGYDSGYSEGQVYAGRGRGGGAAAAVRGGARWTYPDGTTAPEPRPRVRNALIVLLVLVLAWGLGTYFWADSKLRRDVDLSKVEDRPPTGKGTNYLIVGSDSREGLTKQDEKDLHTGADRGPAHRLDDDPAHRFQRRPP